MRQLLSIGEMARINGVSQQALRLYDREGLLRPCVRKENGYRYYDIKQSVVLDIIQYLQSLGISLKDIKSHLYAGDIKSIGEMLQERQLEIQNEIITLQCKERAVERTIENLESYRSAPPDGTILLEQLPQRQAYVLDTGINFYDHDLATYEFLLRKLKEGICENHLPQIYFYNVGTVLRRKSLEKQEFYSTEVFVFVDAQFVPKELITTFPAARYACIYCNDFYKEKEYARRLLAHIQAQNYVIAGDYLCEVIADLPISRPDSREMFLRLQVPVLFHR